MTIVTHFHVGDRVFHKHTREQGTLDAGPHFHTNRSRWWMVRWDTGKLVRVWEVDLRPAPESAE